jgi:hypothetical protein
MTNDEGMTKPECMSGNAVFLRGVEESRDGSLKVSPRDSSTEPVLSRVEGLGMTPAFFVIKSFGLPSSFVI